MKKIALIGSTGSIGRQTLNVVRRNGDFKIVSLASGNNTSAFIEQVKEFNPLVATSINKVENECLKTVEYHHGQTAFTNAIIEEADIVVVAVDGFKGILAVMQAIKMGKDVALANKESLVVGGELVIKSAKERGVNLIPVDSEHSALWQSLCFDKDRPFKKLILTASGGALRDYTKEQLKSATAKDALQHPNWNMGKKITVDCATLVNKGLEVIEAKWLFNTDFDKIDVIIHKESIIHSMVEYEDGAVMAELSYPSMELPISLALTYPNRRDTGLKSLDFSSIQSLTFSQVDHDRFPCFNLVVEAGKRGGTYPAVISGANEVAVDLFIKERINFNDIYSCLHGALDAYKGGVVNGIEDLIEADAFGRKFVLDKFGG